MGPNRLHGLTDGVFAISMTLLVLNLPHPHDSAHLAHDLLQRWPSYAAYLVSFLTVGILWIEHHGMMSAVQQVNRRFLERTLAFLLLVSIIPWPTSIAAEYANRGSQATTAAVLYAGVMLLMGLSFAMGWRYLSGHPQFVVARARPALDAGMRRATYGGLVYLLAITLAFVSPAASFGVDAAVAFYFALSRAEVPGLVAQGGEVEAS
jgi:uncharacterized membrane protein